MKHRLILTSIVVTACLICATNLWPQLAPINPSMMYPKVLAHFWSLPGDLSGLGMFGDVGDSIWMDGGGIIEPVVTEYSWNAPEIKFLRRFDGLNVGASQIMTFDHRYEKYYPPAALEGEPLEHYLLPSSGSPDLHYYHDGAHSSTGKWKSRQQLLGKTKALQIVSGYPQDLYANWEPNKLPVDYFEAARGAYSDSWENEIVDWLSPGWFAMAVGGTIHDMEYADGTILFELEDHGHAYNFEHACWGSQEGNCEGVSNYTYAVVLPDNLEGFPLNNCKGDPPYEILKVTAINEEAGELTAQRDQFGTGYADYYEPGLEIRPLIWANPEIWGNLAFFMNPSEDAPTAYIEGNGPYRWYDVAALFVGNHHLPARVSLDYAPGYGTDFSFYLVDGIWLDAYNDDGLTTKNKDDFARKMHLHAEGIDLNLDDTPDCWEDPYGIWHCDSDRIEAWQAGYEHFFDMVRDYAEDIRGQELGNDFLIVTNGHNAGDRRQWVNGRYYEDTNGGYQDPLGYQQVIGQSLDYVLPDEQYPGDGPPCREPHKILYYERDRDFGKAEDDSTNLAQMRLTLAISMIVTTEAGYYGTRGARNDTRSGDVLDDGKIIEDYYDEYAVDEDGHGFQHSQFDRSDLSYLLGAKYYLGEPLADALAYPLNEEVIYREFDHGVVIAHYGDASSDIYVDIAELDLIEPPTPTCHLMKIFGKEFTNYMNRYNDGRNNGAEYGPTSTVLIDRYLDDDEAVYPAPYPYGPGDAVILLKEGDGFNVRPGCNCGS
jgi:hypothetical protein